MAATGMPVSTRRLAYAFVVRGRVQGVGFRQATVARAASLGLDGWVRNRDDGAVEGEVQSDDAAVIEPFRQWLSQGPAAAKVDQLDWRPVSPAPDTGHFSIRDR